MNIKNSVIFTKKELLYFCIQRFAFGFSYSFMIPIIPLFFNSLGLSTLVIGRVMSLHGVGKALTQMPSGVVSDKIGDKLLLIISYGLLSCIPFSYTFASSKVMACIIYIIQGALLGISAPATFSVLSRSLDENKRGESTGYASAVFTLGGAVGALIGGFIVTKLGNYNFAFYLSSVGIVLSIIFVAIKIKKPETKVRKSNKSKDSQGSSIKDVIKTKKYNKFAPKIILLGAIAFLGDFIYGCIVSIFPFYGQEVLGASAFYTCIIISVYLFVFGVFAPVGGWSSDKIGVKKQLFLSFIVMNSSLFLLSFIRGIIVFTIIIIVYFLGATFLNSALQNSLLKFGDKPEIKSIVFGFVGACESLGYAVSPIVSSFVYELNKRYLFGMLLASSLIVFITFLILYKKAFSLKLS
ncbi:MFS transporter [Clostridium sp. VAP41]|uniref:MFS transporter n=1 Tax=Clostridium sp. VAP41 TaxID=2949979 RepID=UPI00207ABA9C|nr:MFS transporter [Clostridium sp. VAP41]